MKKILTFTAASAIACSAAFGQLISGFDFEVVDFPQGQDTDGWVNNKGAYTTTLSTSSFRQATEPAPFNGSFSSFDTGEMQTGAITPGNAPANGTVAFNNGFNSGNGGLGFQGAISGLAYTYTLDLGAGNLFGSDLLLEFDAYNGVNGNSAGTGVLNITNTIEYSLDGGSFVSLGNNAPTAGSWTEYDFDFAGIADGAQSLAIRYTFGTTSDVDGNTLIGQVDDHIGFDNIAFSGTVIPEPSTYALIVGGLAVVGAAVRRRRA